MNTLQNLIGEPTAAERQAFQKIAAGNAAPALSFSREQLKLIADALLFAEIGFCQQSDYFIAASAKKSDATLVRKLVDKADERFRKSCEARELSEKISAELRRTRA